VVGEVDGGAGGEVLLVAALTSDAGTESNNTTSVYVRCINLSDGSACEGWDPEPNDGAEPEPKLIAQFGKGVSGWQNGNYSYRLGSLSAVLADVVDADGNPGKD